VVEDAISNIYNIPETIQKNKEEKISNKQNRNISFQDMNDDCNDNAKLTEDFFESDEFINDIFKNQKKLKDKIKIDDENNNINNEELIESYETNLFPINTSSKRFIDNDNFQSDNNSTIPNLTPLNDAQLLDFRNKMTAQYGEEGIEKDLVNTKSLDDIIREDNKLKEQYENLNTYYNFAVKSLNYFIPKLGKGLNEENTTEEQENNTNEDRNFEDDVVKKTSFKINQLLMDSVMKI
jgi:hypothetical protein